MAVSWALGKSTHSGGGTLTATALLVRLATVAKIRGGARFRDGAYHAVHRPARRAR